MIYGINIDGVDTYSEYGLILCADLKISKPEPKFKYVSVPEMNGALDLTESLTGSVTYGQREISFNLFAAYDVISGRPSPPDEENFTIILARFSEFIHGKKHKVWFPDDSSFYFEGRLKVGDKGSFRSGIIPVSMTAGAYKMKNERTLTLPQRVRIQVSNTGEPIYPVFTKNTTGTAVVMIDYGTVYETVTVPYGTTVSTAPLKYGNNTVEANAEVSMTYRERRL